MTDASKTPTRLIPFDECIDNLIVRIQPSDANDGAWWQRATVGPFTGLAGVMKPRSLTVVHAPHLLAIDLALATALAVAQESGSVLVVDLRDADIDIVQRIGLVHLGFPELSHPRLVMDEATADDIAHRLQEIRDLPIAVAVDRHLELSALSSLATKWAVAQSKPDAPSPVGLLVVIGCERMVDWRELKILAMQVRCSVVVALTMEERPQSDEYRKADNHADTWIRCDPGVAELSDQRGTLSYQPKLERCWLRPPTALSAIVHDPLRGKCMIRCAGSA